MNIGNEGLFLNYTPEMEEQPNVDKVVNASLVWSESIKNLRFQTSFKTSFKPVCNFLFHLGYLAHVQE